MMRRKRQHNYPSQPYTPLEVGRTSDILAGILNTPTTVLIFFNCTEPKYTPKTNQQPQSKPRGNYYIALEFMAKKLERHG